MQIKVYWTSDKGETLSADADILEITENLVKVGMIVDVYRDFYFSKITGEPVRDKSPYRIDPDTFLEIQNGL